MLGEEIYTLDIRPTFIDEWMLSRSPELSETAKSELLAEARRRGYDAGELIWVRQGKDETTRSRVK